VLDESLGVDKLAAAVRMIARVRFLARVRAHVLGDVLETNETLVALRKQKEKERERKKEKQIDRYIDREKDRERERDRKVQRAGTPKMNVRQSFCILPRNTVNCVSKTNRFDFRLRK
jgi:hypothetical protein